jgi:hypothetical protein
MAGGNSHQRAIAKSAEARMVKQVSATVAEYLTQEHSVAALVPVNTGPHKESHWVHYFVGGSALLVEALALMFGISFLTLGAAVLFWSALRDYKKEFLRGKSPRYRWGFGVYSAVVLVVLTTILPFSIKDFLADRTSKPPEIENANNIPDLAFSFRQIASNKTRPPLLGEGTTIIIIGNLLNNGKMPTSVREWSMKIVPAGEQSEFAGALVGGNFTTLSMRSDSGQEEVLSWKDDYLPEILARKSIAWGETIPGFVVFVVPNVDFETVRLKGTKYTFGFQDALGKEYDFSFVGKGGDQPAQYFPGLSRSSVSSSDQSTRPPSATFKDSTFIGNGTVIQNSDPNARFDFEGGRFEKNGIVFVNNSLSERAKTEQKPSNKH